MTNTIHTPMTKNFQVSCRNKDYYAHFATLDDAIRDAEYEFNKTWEAE